MQEAFLNIFENILGSVREPLVVLGYDLKVVKANDSFYKTFRTEPKETEGVLIYDLGNRQWDIPKLRALLEDILPQNSAFNDYEVEHDFKTIGQKIMHLNARRIHGKTDQAQLILLAIEDVTKRVYYERHLEELVEKRTAEMRVAKEKGCLSYEVFFHMDGKTVFNLIEEWKNHEDLERHIRSEGFSVLLGTKSLLAKPLEMKIHTVSHSEGWKVVRAIRGMGTSKQREILK
jgi:quinol monooxygenase YgiN